MIVRLPCVAVPFSRLTPSFVVDGYGDYAAAQRPFGSSDYSAPAAISCLKYGLPYINSGFGLLSLMSTKPFDSKFARPRARAAI